MQTFRIAFPVTDAIVEYHIKARTPEEAKELFLRGEKGEFRGVSYAEGEDPDSFLVTPIQEGT